MATGFDRRGQTQSPFSTGVDLAQKAGLQPTVAVPGVSRPAGINVQPVDTSMMNELAAWGGKAIQDQASKQMNASLLDGQMAEAQGESFAQVETGGDKWKIEGFHQMEAQTMSAQLLEAQKAEINNSAYAMSPDEYRAQFNTRVDAMLTGKDPRVQDLVRKQIATQIPTLAGAQVGAYSNYAAQRTYEAGVQAVHAVSHDATGDKALAAIVDPGPNSPLAALGPNERRSAITDGVLFAFQNDNPGAYIKMKAAGTFNDFTPDQQARIEAGRKDWMARMAAKFDPVRMEAFTAFNTKLDNGEFKTPMDAVNAAKGMYDKFGIDFDNQQAWQVQTAALTGIGVANQTTANNIQTAVVSGDMGAVANMVAPSLFGMESGGNYGIRGPVLSRPNGTTDRAYGKYQVMGDNIPQWTKEALGRSLTPEQFLANKDAQDAVYKHVFGGYVQQRIAAGQTPMDAVRDAVSMWHSGRPYAQAVADGAHDVNMSTKNYTDTIMGGLIGTPTAQQRLDTSQAALAAATNTANVNAYSQLAPQRDALDQQFVSGQLSQADWQTQRAGLYTQYHMQRTTGDVDQEIAITHAAQTKAATAVSQQAATAFGAKMADAEARMQVITSDPNVTLDAKQAAIKQYSQERNDLMSSIGLPRNPDQEFGFYRGLQSVWQDAVKAEETNGPKRVAIARAAETGTMGTDPSLDPHMKNEWYNNLKQSAADEVQRIIAKDPKMTPQANAMAQSKVMDTLVKAGYIPDDLSSRYTAAISGNLTDKNGVPTKEAISTVTDYMALRDKNPRVADMMFKDDASLAKALQVADWSGNNPANIETAIREIGSAPPMIKGVNTPGDLQAHPEFQSAVKASANEAAYSTLNSWQQLDMFASVPSAESVEAAISDRASKLWATTGGVGNPEPFVKKAAMEIAERSAVIGGSLVVAPAGINVNSEMFGNTDTSGEPNASDTAIRLYIKDHAGEYGIPPNITVPWRDRTTENAGLATPFVAATKYLDQGLNALDPFTSNATDAGLNNFDSTIWPNTFKKTNAGSMVSVTVLDVNGDSTLVQIPLAEAGRAYLDWRKRNTQ